MKLNCKVKDKKIRLNFLVLSMCFIATLFLTIGYASINPLNPEIQGSATVAGAKEIIYISEVKIIDTGEEGSGSINSYAQTMLNTTTTLSETDTTSYVQYQVTIFNNTDDDYIFSQAKYSDEFYDNTDIIFELEGLGENDLLKSKASITFYITFKYSEDISSIDNNVLNSYINFYFVDEDDITNQTQTIDTFYLFLYDNITQIEYEDSPFWGAFVLTDVQQNIDDDTLLYIPLDTIKSLYKQYMGVDIIVDGDEPEYTIMDSTNAYDPINNRKDVTYVKIDGETFIAITDTTGLSPKRTNLFVVSNALNTTEVESFYLFLYNNETLIYADPTPFYGAFDLTDVLENTDFSNTFYIPLEELEEIYYEYTGTNISFKDNPNVTVKFAPSAYKTGESYRENVTYREIDGKTYIRIEDTTGLSPNRSNIFIQVEE